MPFYEIVWRDIANWRTTTLAHARVVLHDPVSSYPFRFGYLKWMNMFDASWGSNTARLGVGKVYVEGRTLMPMQTDAMKHRNI